MSQIDKIRVTLAQIEVVPGLPETNLKTILGAIGQARSDNSGMIVFPEMSIPGYLIGDNWEREAFINECVECGEEIRAASADMVVVFGNVGVDYGKHNEDGRVRKYNALFVAENGRFLKPDSFPYPFVTKTLMPNYREFDDSRHFFDTRKLATELGIPMRDLLAPVHAGGLSLGCILCEDAWDSNYGVSPIEILTEKGVDILINISCSPFTLDKGKRRQKIFSSLSSRLGRPLIYVNNVGIQNNGKTLYTFDGDSCIHDTAGGGTPLLPAFQPAIKTFDIPLEPGKAFGPQIETPPDGSPQILEALSYGTRKFMDQCGLSRIVVGISGGIDSAVVAAIYSRILPPEDLLLVNMPSRFNSSRTIDLAGELAANTGCLYAELPIEDSVTLTVEQLDGLTVKSAGGRAETLSVSDSVKENIQARDRSSRILAAIAATFGGAFTCNANKSEATVGYTTLYGDLCGYLACIADLWKGEVYELASHINSLTPDSPLIPTDILDLPPSAELSNAQNIEEGRGDPLVYRYHDRLFASWVEWWLRVTPEEILGWYSEGILENSIGFEGDISGIFSSPKAFVEDLERWWNQYQGLSIAKRIQAPPVLAVKRRAFGFDHREAQVPVWYSRKYRELKDALLRA